MLEAQTFLFSLLTSQVTFTNPNLYTELEGMQLHSMAEAIKILFKTQVCNHMSESES